MKENSQMWKRMKKQKNIIIVEKYYSKVNIKMDEDGTGKNIILMMLWYAKEDFHIEDIMEKGNNIMIMGRYYSKVNI